MKKIIKLIFNALGIEISRKVKQEGIQFDYYRNEQMIAGMQRSKNRGLNHVNTVIDVGAAQGSWSLSAKELWPEANYLLFEPLEERKTELENLCIKEEKFYYIPSAAGKEEGFIKFYISNDLDGSGIANGVKGATNIREVQVTNIDNQIKNLQLNGPFIVKLDTHGFEVPIIEGCKDIMKDIHLFIIECYGFQIAKDSLLFWEMCQYMYDKGFRLIDIVDVSNRPKDGAFWQCDAFFAPRYINNFNDNTFL